MLVYVLCAASCIVAYLLCGFPTAYVLGKALGKVDVRTVGSGNVGSTNVTRAAGAKAGALTLLIDILKAAVSVLLAFAIMGASVEHEALRPGGAFDWCMALVYLCCVLGHMFTPYLSFKGGKGIAVGFGGAVTFMPLVGLSLWVPFLAFALPSKFVSLGSIAAAASLPFLAALLYDPTAPCLAIVACVAVLVVWAHRSNIKKLLEGRESAFSIKSKKTGAEQAPNGSK